MKEEPDRWKSLQVSRSLFLIFVIACCLLAAFDAAHDMASHPPYRLTECLRGVSIMPYQIRILSPLAIVGLMKWHWGIVNPRGIVRSAHVYVGLCLFFALWFLFRYLSLFFDEMTACFGVLFAALAIKWHTLLQMGDAAGLLFVVALCICVVKRHYILFLYVFALGTLNRETTAMILPAAAILWWSSPKRARGEIVVALAAVFWLASRLALKHYFNLHGNGYDMLSFNLQPSQLFKASMAFGGMWIFAILGFRKIGKDLQILMATTVGFFIVTEIQFAKIFELRIYTELLPVLLPAMLAALGAAPKLRRGDPVPLQTNI